MFIVKFTQILIVASNKIILTTICLALIIIYMMGADSCIVIIIRFWMLIRVEIMVLAKYVLGCFHGKYSLIPTAFD